MDALSGITPNDLWGVHDLLLVGYGGVFMKLDTPGALEVKQAAVELAKLLPQLHPVSECRAAISEVLDSNTEDQAMVSAAAEASWKCLPAAKDTPEFKDAMWSPFTEASLWDNMKAFASRMTEPRHSDILGQCQDSGWKRTCSYWSSLHLMAYRADVLKLGAEFLRAVFPLLASGVTMCGGCTLHFRAIHKPVLSPALESDFGSIF